MLTRIRVFRNNFVADHLGQWKRQELPGQIGGADAASDCFQEDRVD
jgi:hypothetical protein